MSMGKSFTIEYVRNFVEKDGKYELLSDEYINSKTELKVLCLECNKPFATYYNKLYNGTWCPDCGRKRSANKKRLSHEFVKSEIEKDGKYKLLNRYIDSKSYLKLRCCTCSHEWDIKWNNFQQGCGCPKCGMNKTFSSNRLGVAYLKDSILKSGDILLTKNYKNSQSSLEIKCGKCDHIWLTNWSNYRIGKRCPECYILSKASKGVRKIKELLENQSIEYISEYRFDDCKYKHTLPFDFAIFKDNKLELLIEFDGIQHFEPVDFAGKGKEWAEQQFLDTKTRDSIKNLYCKENNIELIRISYKDYDNIENILENKLEI